MPGTIIIKPLKANLIHENEFFGTLNPYCSISLGTQQVSSQVCRNSGKEPQWSDSLMIKRGYEPSCTLQIKDKEWFKSDDTVGTAEIDIQEVESQGRVNKWYKIYKNNEPAGEVLLEAVFSADTPGIYKQTSYQQNYAQSDAYSSDYGRSLYPPGVYSPSKQASLYPGNVTQTPIPGYEYNYQVTYPHVSHNLTSQEYHKLHSRQPERYQPQNKVVPDQDIPQSWEGYKTREWRPESPRGTYQDNITGTGSTMARTPDKYQPFASPRYDASPVGLSYYPSIGGVKYAPGREGQGYKPVYGARSYSPVIEKKTKEEIASEVAQGLDPVKNLLHHYEGEGCDVSTSVSEISSRESSKNIQATSGGIQTLTFDQPSTTYQAYNPIQIQPSSNPIL